MQQTAGAVQLPLNNLGIMALDYTGTVGIATAMGHAPVVGLINPEAGSRMAIAESLTNLVWAPVEEWNSRSQPQRQLDVASKKRW